MLARFERVNRAAICAFATAGVTHVDENLGVIVPHSHACLWAGAEHAALAVQVRGEEFDSGYGFKSCWVCHGFEILAGEKLILRGLHVK
jgi:hypothetical protein